MDFSKFDRYLIASLRVICVGCFLILLVLLTANVLVRLFPVTTIYWFDEVVEWVFAWMVFLGAAALWARDEHFKLEWISQRLRQHRHGSLAAVALEILSLIFLMIFAYQSLRLTILAKDWTPVFNLSRRYLYVCMPVSGVIMLAYSVRNIVRETRTYLKALRAD